MINSNNEKFRVNIVGGGFAGSEAALYLSKCGIDVVLYEMRPVKTDTPFYDSSNFAYPVCSNSFKSVEFTNAHGLLKSEMSVLGSNIIRIAGKSRVRAGKALAVDRELFSKNVTDEISLRPNIKIERREFNAEDVEGLTIISAGPFATDSILNFIKKKSEDGMLHFYDAVSPIISFSSIDMNRCFFGSRYGRGDDYINCPMNEEEYLNFYNALVSAEIVEESGFDKKDLFSGCMPVEDIARQGIKTLLFGVMKPVGFDKKYHAVVQLRKENNDGTMYNIVGFQTRMKWKEQKRVVSTIPGLENAHIFRYGVMHKNPYVNSPKVLDKNLRFKKAQNVYLAGQLTGSEGYMEAAATGLYAAMSLSKSIRGGNLSSPPKESMLGSLISYLTENEGSISPMNANFGIMGERYNKRNKVNIAKNALIKISEWKDEAVC